MLSIRNLTKTYKSGKTAVKNLSLEIKPGEIYGFIGHNGAGKTTTLKCVCGILDFEEGEISIDGVDVKKDPLAAKRLTAYIPDNPDLYDNLSGIRYLNFIADLFAVGKKERESAIAEYAGRLEMTASLGDSISSYSHGMKQKIALISAFIHSPRLVVLDEPFVGLDPKAAHELKQIMAGSCKGGASIFFSTHVLDVAEKLCHKIAIIKSGELITKGDIESVKGQKSLEDLFLELIDTNTGAASRGDNNA